MTLLADTSVLIAPPPGDDDEPLVISVVSVGELHAGVELARHAEVRTQRLRRLTAILASIPVLPIDVAVASRYGELRRISGRAPTNDLWIAATALAHDLTLITRDAGLAGLDPVRIRYVP